jgi:HlyD family secretion protein
MQEAEKVKFKNRKALLLGAGILAFAAIGSWAYLEGQNHVEYQTAVVQRGPIEATISATGTPNAVVTVQVGSQVSGNISALYADFNTHVTKGQLVARIEPSIFQARVDLARANLENALAAVASARANLQRAAADVATAQANAAVARQNTAKAKVAVLDAKSKLERRVDLFRQGILSTEDRDTAQATYDANLAALEAAQAQENAAQAGIRAAEAQRQAAQTQLEQAEAQVKQSRASLQQAEIDLEHTYIRAPVDGIVVARRVDVGQTVAAGFQAPTLFEIAQDLTKMQVDTNVDEADIGRVQVGQLATFTVDAYPGHVFTGTVREIRKAPINLQNVVTYDAVIAVANPDLKLFPGMTANVRILVDSRASALKIPNAALRFRPIASLEQAPRTAFGKNTAGRPRAQTVWVVGEGGKPVPVPVELGISDGTYTEVLRGNLAEGQQVIVGLASKQQASAAGSRAGQTGGRRGPGF